MHSSMWDPQGGACEAFALLATRIIETEQPKAGLDRREVSPTVPLFAEGWGDPTIVERVDELLAETGFGR